jgi:hypothetical protein
VRQRQTAEEEIIGGPPVSRTCSTAPRSTTCCSAEQRVGSTSPTSILARIVPVKPVEGSPAA